MKFYLGTHMPSWLTVPHGAPLFISRNRLVKRRRFKTAAVDWALDSGGFTELTHHGEWTIGPGEYADEVRRYSEGFGAPDTAYIQDWMCEPAVRLGGVISGRVAPGTGKSVLEHQLLTVKSLLDLEFIAPEVSWGPVLQGWELEDYVAHIEIYEKWGVDLRTYPVVGVGSVCRRQGTNKIAEILKELSSYGLKLHGFGVKTLGLRKAAGYLVSADSMAWSFTARREKIKLPECAFEKHRNCANCLTWALKWREEVISEIPTGA